MPDKKIPINVPIDWQNSWKLSEQSKSIYFERDEFGNIKAMPVIVVDPGVSPMPASAIRTPSIFKTTNAITGAGDSALWTPELGKKFRLMGGIITLAKDAACVGAFRITVKDSAIPLLQFSISAGALVAIGDVVLMPFNFPGSGYLSAVANNILYLNLGAALTAGEVSMSVWGVEE